MQVFSLQSFFIADFCKSTAQQLLQFIYTGSVTVKNNSDFEQLTQLGQNQLGFSLNFEWNSTFKTQGCDIFNLSLRDPNKVTIATPKPSQMLRPTPKEMTQLAIASPKPGATGKSAVTVKIEKVSKIPNIEPVSRTPIIEPVLRTQIIEQVSRTPITEKVSKTQITESVSKTQIIEKVLKTQMIENFSKNALTKKVSKTPNTEKVAKTSIIGKVLSTPKIEKAVRTPKIEKVLTSPSIKKVSASRITRSTNPFSKLRVSKIPLMREKITNKPLLSSMLNETDELSYKKKMRKLISRKNEASFFSCSFCQYQNASRCNIFFHIEAKHLKTKRYQCNFCEIKVTNRRSLWMHTSTSHREEHKIFKEKDTVEAMMLQNEAQGSQINDPLKQLNFDDSAELVDPLLPDDLFKIDFEIKTEKTVAEQVDPQEHQAKVNAQITENFEDNTFSCNICQIEKKSKLTIFNHIESNHLKSLKFQCNYCGIFRTNRGALGAHISSKHKGQTGTFLPAESNELPLEVLIQEDPQDWSMLEMPSDISLALGYDSYNNNAIDEDHKGVNVKLLVKANPTMGTFTCIICEKIGTRRHRIYHHVKMKHINKSSFSCKLCTDNFTSFNALQFHLKECSSSLGTNIKSFYEAEDSGALVITKEIKQLVKQGPLKGLYTCTICQKTGTKKKGLYQHILKQHKSKSGSPKPEFSSSFQEDFINSSLESNEEIDYSARVNAYIAKDIRKDTYYCRVCPLVRPRKHQIFSHIEAKHLKIKRYSCDICNCKFNSKPSLIAHTKAKHKDNLKAATEQDPLASEGLEEMEIQESAGID